MDSTPIFSKKKQFRTSDIHVATVLMCLGYRLEDVGRSGNRVGKKPRAIFYFHDTKELRSQLLQYDNDELEMSPRRLFSRLRDLKSRSINI